MRADARRNRERILAGAREVFAEFGAEAQIDDVARQAGVGVGTVYRHFPTKEALLVELAREKFREFAASGLEALRRHEEPFAVLCDWLSANAVALASDAAMQQAVTGAGEQMLLGAASEQQELIAVTNRLVDRARATGTIRADATGNDVGMLMCGLCASMAHPAPGFDWHRYLELAIDALRPR